MIIWGNPELQRLVFLVGISVLASVAILVSIFAWFKPKHLVYGETGHRAEMKLTFGTEKDELSQSEIASLPGTEKVNVLPASGETS